MTRTTNLAAPAILTIAALSLAACAPGDENGDFAGFADGAEETAAADTEGTDDEAQTASSNGDEEEDQSGEDEDVIYAEVDDPVTFEECETAEEDENATVTWLDDVSLPEERHSGTEDEVVEVSGEEIVIPGTPDVIVPERTAQAGCIIKYDSSANCLPSVEISSAYIPGYTLPERTLPSVDLPDGTVLEEHVIPAESQDAQHIEAQSADEVCQQDEEEADDGDIISGVTRSGITRSGATQSGTTQSGHTRSGETLEDGSSINYTSVDYLSVGYLSLPYVSIGYETLEYYILDGADHTERSGEDTVSYTTEGDVLFDTGEYELRSDAESELQAIATDIENLGQQDFTIEVEGHTDDEPVTSTDRSFSDNYELSELRAEAVQDWLEDNAGVASDEISAAGLGEDYPRADNSTEEGREQNRRVVITVIPDSAAEAEIEYELEEE